MAVFAPEHTPFGPSSARPDRQYSHILLLYIPVQIVHVRCGDKFISFPSCNLTEGVWSRKWRVISFVLQVSG
jgi:hypothetical protein